MTPMTPNNLPARVGAPNVGPLRNGSRARVALGTLPKRLARLGRGVAEYRRALEAAVEARWGHITPEAAHHITLAAEAFQWGAVARWTMRQTGISAGDTLKAAEAIVKAGQARNAAVAKLDLRELTPAEQQAQQYEDYLVSARQRQRLPPAAPTTEQEP